MNLKNDDFLCFLNQFAYEGKALDKETLIKFLARNDGIIYTKYAQFCYELVDLHRNLQD